jgi:hypothetical protein
MATTTSTSTIDGIPLGGPGTAGAAFRLTTPSPVDAEFDRGDGWTARVAEGSAVVAVEGSGCDNYTQAVTSAIDVAHQALDLFSARGRADLTTDNTENFHIALWNESGASVLRVVAITLLRASVGSVEVVVRNAAGAIVPQPAPVEVWHQSMRFYRLSQLSEDLFDSLRSLWLAVENLLDSVEPQAPGEREGQWLKRALQAAGAMVNLNRYLPAGSAKQPHNQAYEYFYDQLRVSIFHAKGSRGPQLPQDVTGMADLAERHERLTRFYLDLLDEVTKVRRASGGMTYDGFDLTTPEFEPGSEVHVTDDPAPCEKTDTSVSPNGHSVVIATAARERSLERRGLKLLLAQFAGADVEALDAVRRLGHVFDGTLLTCATVDADLRVRSVDRFEVQVGLRLKNLGLPRAFVAL